MRTLRKKTCGDLGLPAARRASFTSATMPAKVGVAHDVPADRDDDQLCRKRA